MMAKKAGEVNKEDGQIRCPKVQRVQCNAVRIARQFGEDLITTFRGERLIAGNRGAGLLDRFGESAANRAEYEGRNFALRGQR